jgi:hypothetical protein
LLLLLLVSLVSSDQDLRFHDAPQMRSHHNHISTDSKYCLMQMIV